MRPRGSIDVPSGFHLDVGTETAQHVEERRSGRVQADVVDDGARARHRRGRRQQERGARDVAGNVDLGGMQRGRAGDAQRRAVALTADAERAQQALGVVARRDRAVDARHAVSV